MNHLVGQALSQAACGQWYSHPWVQPRAAQAGWVQTHAGRLRTRPSLELNHLVGQAVAQAQCGSARSAVPPLPWQAVCPPGFYHVPGSWYTCQPDRSLAQMAHAGRLRTRPTLEKVHAGTMFAAVNPVSGPYPGAKCSRMVCTVDSLTHQMSCHDLYYPC